MQIANKNRQRKHSSIHDIGRKFLLAKTAKKFVNVSGSNILLATCTSLTVRLTSHDRRKSTVGQAAKNVRPSLEQQLSHNTKSFVKTKSRTRLQGKLSRRTDITSSMNTYGNLLTATTAWTPKNRAFSICLTRFTIPLLMRSRFWK